MVTQQARVITGTVAFICERSFLETNTVVGAADSVAWVENKLTALSDRPVRTIALVV